MDKNSFTLIELAIVAIIVGLLALVAVPSMLKGVQRGYAKDAMRNLMVIYAAEQNYYQNNNGNYYFLGNFGAPPTYDECDGRDGINTGLGTNIISSDSTHYCCKQPPTGPSQPPFCFAINQNSNFTMFFDQNGQLTGNNSPLYCGTNYPCCLITGGQQAGSLCP